MEIIEVKNLKKSFGSIKAVKGIDFQVHQGQLFAFLGCNGAGKSTFIKFCTEQLIPDSGRIVWQPNTKIGYLDQYAQIEKSTIMRVFLQSAFSELYEMENRMNQLYCQSVDGNMSKLDMAARYQEELERNEFYLIDTKIEQVTTGLGLMAIGLDRPIEQMSGGQRAKVILAKLLLEKPDILLLDEPTNFLDKEHVVWLAEYLSSLQNAFMVVSHDYEFLEKISTRICDIDNQKITKYFGTYYEFRRKKALLREDYIRQYGQDGSD